MTAQTSCGAYVGRALVRRALDQLMGACQPGPCDSPRSEGAALRSTTVPGQDRAVPWKVAPFWKRVGGF